MYKWWLVVRKKEMTKMWVNGAFVSVTLVEVIQQEVLRYKNNEKDGYVAVVVGVEKKKKTSIGKLPYRLITEFLVDKDFVQNHKEGGILDTTILEGVEELSVIGTAKGKGFQWAMKRFHLKGGPETHGSKFHRQIGSLGNRKPRRVQMGHPHAGRMGGQRVTLKKIKIIDKIAADGESLVVVKGSLPWAYNDTLKFVID